MPYVTVRSVNPNTTGNRGAHSGIGHAWVEISDSQFSPMPNGGTESFGFYPEQPGQPYMPGTVKGTDYADFVGHGNSSPPIYITEAQAQSLRNFAGQVEATGFSKKTSALDYESERVIQNNMKAICKGRSVLIIAHRLSAVRDAHRIIVLDRGQIVEQGSHAELLAHEAGHYSRLHRLQQG